MSKEYTELMEANEAFRKAVVKDAFYNIDPDKAGLDRHNITVLLGAAYTEDFSADDVAMILSKSRMDKGTFAKQYANGKFTGGKASWRTIVDYAKKSGWKYPDPQKILGDGATSIQGGVKRPEPVYRIKVHMDEGEYKEKPLKAEIREIREREKLDVFQYEEYTLQEFCNGVLNGHSFYPTITRKHIDPDKNGEAHSVYDVGALQLLIADIDNEEFVKGEDGAKVKRCIENPLKPEQAIEICKNNGLQPFLVYETFSSKLHRTNQDEPYKKFRVCVALDKPMTAEEYGTEGIRQAITKFIGLFGKAADQNVKDGARLIFGTDEKQSALFFNKVVKLNTVSDFLYKPIARLPQEVTATWGSAELKRDSNGKILQTIANAVYAIENDPGLQNKIKYNVLSYTPFICGSLPWEKTRNYREWNNKDDSNLKCYIEDIYNIKSAEKIMDALNIVSNKNAYNPVIDMLKQCHSKWDGRPHIRKLLVQYMGCEDNQYNYEVMKLYMLAAISRVFSPGCKFDNMLVIYGDQGIGKSTFLRRLALNPEWFCDNFKSIEGDKAAEGLRGMWMVELAELLALKGTQAVESIKAFLSSRIDVYRPPYERRTESRPRMCVIAGTTNDKQFLTDKTGNRRFYIVEARKKYITKSVHDDACIDDFVQAWGEAMEIFKQANGKVDLILDDCVMEQAEQMREAYTEEDPRTGIIQGWLDMQKSDAKVCITMLYREALLNHNETPNRKESNELHTIMQHSIIGWKRLENGNQGRAKCGNYGTQICYVRDETTQDGVFM